MSNGPQNPRPVKTGSTFFERLMYYVFGLLIGVVMLVVIAAGRQWSNVRSVAEQERLKAEAARQQAQQAPQITAPKAAAETAGNPRTDSTPTP